MALPGSSIGFKRTKDIFRLEFIYLGNNSLPATIINRNNAHCIAGFPMGSAMTDKGLNGADSLVLLLQRERFTGRVHYLTVITINYADN